LSGAIQAQLQIQKFFKIPLYKDFSGAIWLPFILHASQFSFCLDCKVLVAHALALNLTKLYLLPAFSVTLTGWQLSIP
jgi:hypothetical protein